MLDGYLGLSGTDWQRSQNATLAQHLKDKEESILRNYFIGAMISSNGRVLYNQSGRGFTWPVMYRLHDMEGNLGEGPLSYQRTDQFKTAGLPFRGYTVSDWVSDAEARANRGAEQIIAIMDGMGDRLETSLSQRLGPMYFVNGDASGNEKGWHGFDSMFKTDATVRTTNSTVGASLNTARTANDADKTAWMTGEYAQVQTQLGNYGGAAESGIYWLEGDPSPEYDVWTPPYINSGASAFTTIRDAMRYLIVHSGRRGMATERISHMSMSRGKWIEFVGGLESKQNIWVTTELPEHALGFKETLSFEGVKVTPDTAVGSGLVYGFNPANIELRCQTGQLFEPRVIPDPQNQATKFDVSTFSNLKFKNPSLFGKMKDLA